MPRKSRALSFGESQDGNDLSEGKTMTIKFINQQSRKTIMEADNVPIAHPNDVVILSCRLYLVQKRYFDYDHNIVEIFVLPVSK